MEDTTQQSSAVLQGVVDEVLSALALALGARRAAAFALGGDATSCRAVGSFGLSDEERERVGHWLTIDDASRPYWTRLAAEARPLYLPGGDVRAPWQGAASPVPA
ncbi:MAG TPA: hypothetical protein VGK30_01275, partial [Candidatus Binatia bacterium]